MVNKTAEESEYITTEDRVFVQKKKPVSLSLTDKQIDKLDERASQTGLNRSAQIQRDLNAYWFMLRDGLARLKKEMTIDDAKYVAEIFRGRALSACDDAVWSDEFLCTFVRKFGVYGDAERAAKIAGILESAGTLARFALMDWVRRVSLNLKDVRLFEGWASGEQFFTKV